jgi:hypothetical protein
LVVAAIARLIVIQIMPAESKFDAIFIILIVGSIGGLVYGAIALRIGIAQKLFGERLTRFTKKFGL